MSKGEHGEPCVGQEVPRRLDAGSTGGDYIVTGADGLERLVLVDVSPTVREWLDHAVKCVNAPNGRDPEKLEGLLIAVKSLVHEAADWSDDMHVGRRRSEDALQCLTALRAFAPDLFEEEGQ
jgi:hypothetical protein